VTFFISLLLLLLQASPADAIASDASVDQILDRVDAQSSALENYSARMRLDSRDALSDETERRFGQIYFEVKPPKRRAAVVFQQTIDPSGRGRNRLEHYVYSDGVLSDYDHEAKRLTRRELVRPGESRDPLRLGDGPVPIPFGQRKDDIVKAFQVTPGPAPPSELVKDPTTVAGLHLVPRPGTLLAERGRMSSIDLWLDRATASPVAVVIHESDGDRVSAKFSSPSINAGLDDESRRWLDAPQVDPRDWRIESR
jgi:outer membrane lipoprotein-sorting protein